MWRKFFYRVKNFWRKPVALGKRGEDDAARFLRRAGYAILARNWTHTKGYRVGEIDIVAREGGVLVFVEVKTRRKEGVVSAPPENAITKKKMRHIERCAYRYLREKNQLQKPYRFDAISVTYEENGEKIIRHIKNVFV